MNLKETFWEKTYQRNIGKMIGICFRYVSEKQVAEDLAHDAFVTAMDKSGTFRGKGHFDAWLRKITVNTALMYLREKKQMNENQKDYSRDVSGIQQETNTMGQEFTQNELIEAINTLPEHHRLVFNLYVIDNYSHKKIAVELDISEGTSKSHLARARKKLRTILDKKQKEKRRKNIFFLLLPFGNGNTDRPFRRNLSKFEIEPATPVVQKNINWTKGKHPVFKNFAFLKTAIIIFGAGTIITGIVFLNDEKQQDKIKTKEITPAIINTITQKEEAKPVEIKPDTTIKEPVAVKKKPIVIKKQRVVRKKVVVKDTLTIIDTTNVR